MIAQRQLRSDEPDLSETLKRKFSRIFDAAERLERLLSGFLASASVEGKDITLARRRVDLNDIVSIALEQISEANPGRILETSLSDQPLRVDADPVLLEQVVLNLLSNAVKYSEAPAAVMLATWQENNKVFCRVTDHGAGIPEEAQGAIFDRFYRAANVHRLPGVGVGLSLVRDIVSLHGGEVSFTSRVGGGSEFTVARRLRVDLLSGADLPEIRMSKREEEVLALLGHGERTGGIATSLGISEHTVSQYIKELYKKLGINNRADAARIAISMGLVGSIKH